MAGQGRHVLIVEDEQAERYALRALLEVWEHRVGEAENGARGIELVLDRRPERGMTSHVRAGFGLLVVPLVVAGYAGLTGLILPLVALGSVFPSSWSASAARRPASPRGGASAATLGAVARDREDHGEAP